MLLLTLLNRSLQLSAEGPQSEVVRHGDREPCVELTASQAKQNIKKRQRVQGLGFRVSTTHPDNAWAVPLLFVLVLGVAYVQRQSFVPQDVPFPRFWYSEDVHLKVAQLAQPDCGPHPPVGAGTVLLQPRRQLSSFLPLLGPAFASCRLWHYLTSLDRSYGGPLTILHWSRLATAQDDARSNV